MNMNVTKIIRNLSLSVFLATSAISMWLALFYIMPAINEYQLSVEQNKQVQKDMMSKAKKIQNILFETILAATAIYLANENVLNLSDSEKLVKESIDTLGIYSDRFSLLAKYVSDYQLKEQRQNVLFEKSRQEEIIDTGVSKLNISDVKGSFVQSENDGQLFVIKGMVINNNSKKRSHILLRGSLFDKRHELVRQKEVYAGNTFSDSELKNMPMVEIEEMLRNPSGKENMNVNIRNREKVPFMIVFSDLPNNLSEFVVEAVSSSPGK